MIYRRLAGALLLVALLTACGNNATPVSSELTQDISLYNDATGITLAVRYPDKWFAHAIPDEGAILVTNSESLVDDFAAGELPTKAPGDSGFVMVNLMTTEISVQLGFSAIEPLVDTLATFMEAFQGSLEFTPPEEITVGDLPLAMTAVQDDNADGMLFVTRKKRQFVLVTCNTHKGGLDVYRDAFIAVAGSITME